MAKQLFIHDILKIKYANSGFLPNYPYHLISDEEMCDAFLSMDKQCFFFDTYPLVTPKYTAEYDLLVNDIKFFVDRLKNPDDKGFIPNWLYTYMLGEVIGPYSDTRDIHDLLVDFDIDNLDDEFTEELAISCYETSKRWILKLPSDKLFHRPPTMFGEPHVIKSLRLQKSINDI